MTTQNKNVPALRFSEFNDDWKINPLGNSLSLLTDFEANGSFEDSKNNVTVYDEQNFAWYVRATDLENDSKLNSVKFVDERSYNFLRKTPLFGGELLISKRGEIGKVYFYEDKYSIKATVAPNMYLLKMKEDTEPKFFYYHFINTKGNNSLKRINASSTIGALYKDDVKKLKLSIPTLPEQQKIAAFLTAVDEKIQQLAKKKDLLEQYKKGVMQKIFNQEIRFKDDNGNDFADWEEKPLKHFIIEHRGGAPLKPSDFVKESICEVIPKKGIVNGGELVLDLDKPTYCSESFFKSYQKSVIDNSFLVTTLRDLVPSAPSIGYIVKYKTNKKYMLAQGVYGLKISNELFDDFLIQFSNTEKYRKVMQTIKVGSTQVHITNEVFFGIKIPVPSIPEQIKIADFLSAIDDKIKFVNQQLEKTKEYKKGLLQQMFV